MTINSGTDSVGLQGAKAIGSERAASLREFSWAARHDSSVIHNPPSGLKARIEGVPETGTNENELSRNDKVRIEAASENVPENVIEPDSKAPDSNVTSVPEAQPAVERTSLAFLPYRLTCYGTRCKIDATFDMESSRRDSAAQDDARSLETFNRFALF